MDMEWFRDLSITILGFVATAALILITVLIYRLYSQAKTTIQLVKATAKIVYDTATLVQQGPLVAILTIVQSIWKKLRGISKNFTKESSKGENKNE
jgi:muramidase (phage lysozyme)